ncbi:chemotaxis protein CheC, partial [Bacillus sp. SIMBA_069]
VVVTVFLRVEGDCPGNMFFILDVDSAKYLLLQITGIDKDVYEWGELEVSALHEIGNILTGSYLSSLADLTKLNLQPS